jgi:hypothetical protein
MGRGMRGMGRFPKVGAGGARPCRFAGGLSSLKQHDGETPRREWNDLHGGKSHDL